MQNMKGQNVYAMKIIRNNMALAIVSTNLSFFMLKT